MLFYIFTAVSGLLLSFGALLGAKKLSEKFQLPRKIFWKAGLMLLILEVFHLAVLGNLTSIWPGLENIPLWQKAALFGLMTGLFFELGRFVVLDKLMPNIRSLKEGLFFGFGWSGVLTFFLGILLLISVAGIHMLATTTDLVKTFPQATPEEIKQIQEYQKQVFDLLQGSPVVALLPLLERATQLLLDMALTLLLLLGFQKGSSRFVWYAVGVRALVGALLILATGYFDIWGELVLVVVGLLSFGGIWRMREMFLKEK